MPNHSYEIEIKSLLGNQENAGQLLEKMRASDPAMQILGSHKQLNHYFVDGDLKRLFKNVADIIETDKREKLKTLAEKAKDYSVRTRWADRNVILVIKASVDDTTSSNGTARLEWESHVKISIEELDKLVLKSGFKYQAKWSRERQEYIYHPHLTSPIKGEESIVPSPAAGRAREGGIEISVSIDKNAGYGHLAEFEKQIEDESKTEETKSFIRNAMKELGIAELPQDRLERMFDYYNKHWQEYYGTDKIFIIK
jgi:adenylate cyclase class IV